jgi:predicted nucleotidyltransferase
METTKNDLSPFEQQFFTKMRNYLGVPIYFYGSIQRDDYFKGRSDIDVVIFTENESSMVKQLQAFLNIDLYKLKKIIHKPHFSDRVAFGYKIKYKDENHNFAVEISIFDKKYKTLVLKDHDMKSKLPFYVSFVLTLIKVLYYDLKIITKETYRSIKHFAMNNLLHRAHSHFIAIEGLTP